MAGACGGSWRIMCMMQKKVPLVSMDLYLHRKHGVVSGVIHDMRTGRWACITCLDQLFLYLDDVLNDMSSDRDDRDRERRRPELGEKSESFARIPSNDVKKLELQITGGKHKTLQGQIYLAGEESGEPRPFSSCLELLKRIHQLI